MPKYSDEYFMQKALDLAEKAMGNTSPNPMAGAVIVSKNRIIASGYHKVCGSKHAEIIALNKLKKVPSGSIMYITLEPCYHFGKTPPCVDKIIESGIKKVVIAMNDPNPLTNGKSVVKMRRNRISVKVGVLENKAKTLIEIFIKNITTGLPFVVVKIAQTIDGKIATKTGSSKWITSQYARKYSHKERDEFDAILVGINTILKDNPSLSGTKRKFSKIVLDTTLKISRNARLFKKSTPDRCFIATTRRASLEKRILLERKGISVVMCPSKNGKVDIKWLLKKLAKDGITSILIEGGSQVIGSAIKSGIVDKMHIYIAPKILGDNNAKSSVDGLNISDINKIVNLKDITIKNIGKDILVKAYVLRHN